MTLISIYIVQSRPGMLELLKVINKKNAITN
jgi:hypothetical protein